MRSLVCNIKDFCYITPIVKNETGEINIVCEGFVITATRNVYAFILESMFKMCSLRSKYNIYAILSDKFMKKSILASMRMSNIFVFSIFFISK